MKERLLIICLLVINPVAAIVSAQTQSYKQPNNENDFNYTLNDKWALEVDIGQSWTSKPGNESIFSYLSQLYGTAGVHYTLNDRWKLSLVYGFYFNKYVPEIDQRAAPEWRTAFQAVYYIHRKRAVISTQMQLEDRHIQNTDTVFEAVERYRPQIKIVYPFNGEAISKRIIYAIASEELIFKSNSKISGNGFFDRNKLTVGLGYGFTDRLQLEIAYVNESLPREISNNYNEFQINVIYNDFLARLKNKLFGKKEKPEGSY